MNPAPAAPAMKVARLEMADVSVPAPFAVLRYGRLGYGQQGGNGERRTHYRRSQQHASVSYWMYNKPRLGIGRQV